MAETNQRRAGSPLWAAAGAGPGTGARSGHVKDGRIALTRFPQKRRALERRRRGKGGSQSQVDLGGQITVLP